MNEQRKRTSLMLRYPASPLSDGTILLRPWTEQDLPALEQASHDPYIPATTSVPSPYTHAEGLKWLERQQQRVLENVGLPFCIADAQTDCHLTHILAKKGRYGSCAHRGLTTRLPC